MKKRNLIAAGVAGLLFSCSSFAISPKTVEICQGLWSGTVSCLSEFQFTQHDADAATSCGDSMMGPPSTLSCLRATANNSYSPGVVEICDDMYGPSKSSCFKVSANKVYEDYALESCKDEWTPTAKISCLKQLGSSSLEAVIVEGIIDIFDDFMNQRQNNTRLPRRDNQTFTPIKKQCDIQNSTGKSFGTIYMDQLSTAASRFAESENSCVVSNIKGKNKSRILYGKRGGELGRDLSISGTKALKERHSFTRCRVLTCVVK